jgi:surface protein
MCPSTDIIITVNETVEQVDITVNDTVTEVPITISEATSGLSAYQIAVTNGYIGTEEEWLESLLPDTSTYALKSELPTTEEKNTWSGKQDALPTLETYLSFATYTDMLAYLSNPLRYAGQLATCKDKEGIVYILNNDTTAWLDVLSRTVNLEDEIAAMFLTAFISTWNTNIMQKADMENGQNMAKFKAGIFIYTDIPGISEPNQIHLPFTNWGTYDCYVDWGDGSEISHITAYDQEEVLHTFPDKGIYTVKIAGTCIGWGFADSQDFVKLINISKWGILNPTAPYGGQFYGCQNMTCTATDAPDMTGITVLHATFAYCWKFNGTIGNWDTSTVSYMKYTFLACFSFDQDLSSWNFSNVAQNLSPFIIATNISVPNYDKLLISLSNQVLYPNLWMFAVGCFYSSAAIAARATLTGPINNWDIVDSGLYDTISLNVSLSPFNSDHKAQITVTNQSNIIVTGKCTFVSDNWQATVDEYGVVTQNTQTFEYPMVNISITFLGLTPTILQLGW